jgi:hypothetical protein
MAGLASRFDPIEYAKQLRNAGVSQEQADIQAQAIETVINDIVSNQELVTKRDLAELKLELIKWMIGTGIAGVLAIAGLIKYIH